MSTPIFPAPAYTDLDQAQIWARLRELAGSVYPDLDLDNKAEVIRLLLEGEAYIGDIISDLMRRKGRESRWGTAEQRQSVLAGLKLIDYRPTGAKAATVEVVLTLSSAALAPITIETGRTVRTNEEADPVRFQLLAPLTIPTGASTATATVEHSTTWPESYLSSGKPNQRYLLQHSPYVDGSILVSTTVGPWTEVRNFISSGPSSLHFMTLIDAQDRVTLIFGNGRNGALPTGQIDITYKTGGGARGQLGPNTLTVLDGQVADATGRAVRISVTNPDKTTGGIDRQATELIKILAPAAIRSPISSVAREDYEIHAREIPGVARALHLTRNQDPAILENEGYLWVVPDDGGDPTSLLLSQVAAQFGDEVTIAGQSTVTVLPRGPYAKTVTYQLRVRGAVYKVIDVFARVWLSQTAVRAKVKASVVYALAQLVAPMVDARLLGKATGGLVPNPAVDFGWNLKDADGQPVGSIARSDIYNAVRDTAGILRVGPARTDFMLNSTPDVDVAIAAREFPRLGTVTLLDGKTGTEII